MARLIVLAGSNMGEACELGQTNSIGSGEGNAVQLVDGDVNEYHAQLSRVKGRYYIVNLTVDNVVEVNGREIEKLMLSNGDSIKVGDTVLLFSDEEESEDDDNSDEGALTETEKGHDIDFGKYNIVEEISRGAHAVVYKAIQKGLERVVALKVLLAGEHASREDITRFYSEARAVARLTHPNIVPIFDIGYIRQTHYFAMEYIDGQTLEDLLEKQAVSPRRGMAIIADIASALSYAHQQNIIHRDIKPSNILVDKYGKAMLSDFGIAKQLGVERSNTQTGQAIGTPSYMAPEQAEGKLRATPQADIYSLGAVLYEIFTEQKPYDGTTAANILMKVLTEEPAPPMKLNPNMNPDVSTIIQKAMEREPIRRYNNAKEMGDDINNFMRGLAIAAKPRSRYYQFIRTVRKNMVVIAAVFVAMMSTLASIFYISLTSERSQKAISEARQEARKTLEEKIAEEKEKVLEMETPQWEEVVTARDDGLKAWNIQNGHVHENVRVSTKGDNLLARYKNTLSGNIELQFNYTIPEDGNVGTVSVFMGNNENSGLRFIFGKWQQDEMVIMRAGKVLASRGITLPEPGQTLSINVRLENLQAWLDVTNGANESTSLSYRGFDLLQLDSKRNVGLRLEKSNGGIASDILLRQQSLPLRPNRLVIAHDAFFKQKAREAYSEYTLIATSAAYEDNVISLEAKYWAGQAQQSMRHFAKARELYTQILKADPELLAKDPTLVKRCHLQLFFCLANEGQFKKAALTLKELNTLNGTTQLETPWEWRIADLLSRFISTNNHDEAIDVVAAVQWTPNNRLVVRPLRDLSLRLVGNRSDRLAKLALAYPHPYINEAFKQSINKLTKGRKYSSIEPLLAQYLINTIQPDQEVHKQLVETFKSMQNTSLPKENLLAYFYKYSDMKPSIEPLLMPHMDKLMKSNEYDAMTAIYLHYPLPTLLPKLIQAEEQLIDQKRRRRPTDKEDPLVSSLVRADSPVSENLDVASEILLETNQIPRATRYLERYTNNESRGFNSMLSLRYHFARQMAAPEELFAGWESLSVDAPENSLANILASLMEGEVDPLTARNELGNPEWGYLVSFFAGLRHFIIGDYEVARIYLRESLSENTRKGWPLRCTQRLLEEIQ